MKADGACIGAGPRARASSRRRGALASVCVLLLSASALMGCVSPVGVLEPVRTASPQATSLDILVATTRERSDDAGVVFSGDRGEAAFATVDVSIPPDSRRQIGEVQWPRSVPPDPASEFATLRIDQSLTSKEVEDWLRRHDGRDRRVLLFIHGFNTRFEEALFGFAQIFHDSGAEAAPVLFSWPSRGSVFNYVYDRESATFSRDALESLLHRLAASPNVKEIVVLAHSMGAWLAMESLRQMAIREGRVPAKIQNVILASPDIDVDVFRAQLEAFGEKRPEMTVFVSGQDRALRLSRGIGGDVERLGAADPAQKPWIAEKGVEVIDLSGAGGGDQLRHSKFAQNPDVVRFLGAELINGATRDPRAGTGERIGGVPMGVAQGVGDAAGLFLSAPVAILDPQFRRAYSTRAQQFWQGAEEAVERGPGPR
ncbi:alpha/beta hydrolase [Methylocystis echinoides]|nr:alpha/beta hydrolase [Methylocystis echinoides]